MPDGLEPADKAVIGADPHPARRDGGPVYPGSTLDWSSPPVPIQLYVELPFWLMTPESNFAVKHGDTTLRISVAHGCDEIQTTTTHLKNRASTAFVARPGEVPPPATQERIDKSKSGCSVHIQRTTLIIDSVALRSALQAVVQGASPNNRHGMMYLTALAAGHLPFVNALITAYRRASYDHFVREVTTATVPIWFLRFQDQFFRVSLYPYANQQYRLHVQKDGESVPVDLAATAEVEALLARPESPGETLLLDAWSHYYAGRYSDGIRALVTAIGVILEARYSEALTANGRTDEQAGAALKATATKFLTRLHDYLALTKRTLPGPLLSHIPYINGVRLREELIQTRDLRHKLVHSDHRFSPAAHGSMQRHAETMT